MSKRNNRREIQMLDIERIADWIVDETNPQTLTTTIKQSFDRDGNHLGKEVVESKSRAESINARSAIVNSLIKVIMEPDGDVPPMDETEFSAAQKLAYNTLLENNFLIFRNE